MRAKLAGMKGVRVYFTALIVPTLANLCLCVPMATATDCKRVPRLEQYIGIDNMRKSVYLDTGKCQSVSVTERSVNTTDYCPGARCVPTSTDYVTFNLLNVVKNYLVIKECGLDLSQCSSCKREQNFVRFFAGTPNEQVVDTGRCGGQCSQQGEDLSCKATAMRSKAVNGPNGDLIVDVTEECSCQGECYRMSYWESYFEKITDARGHTKVEEKLVDVGRCTGSCRQDPIALCLINSKNGCDLGAQPVCRPDRQSLTKKQFTDRQGDIQSLTIVGKCKC